MKNLNQAVVAGVAVLVVGGVLFGVGAYKRSAQAPAPLAATTTEAAQVPVSAPAQAKPQAPSGPVVAITTESVLPNATSGEPYTVAIQTTGGSAAAGYHWSVDGGRALEFPIAGLEIGKQGSVVSLTGTPGEVQFDGVRTTKPVTFSFSLTVRSGWQTDTKTFKLKVYPATAE